jgi:hypothetical protein
LGGCHWVGGWVGVTLPRSRRGVISWPVGKKEPGCWERRQRSWGRGATACAAAPVIRAEQVVDARDACDRLRGLVEGGLDDRMRAIDAALAATTAGHVATIAGAEASALAAMHGVVSDGAERYGQRLETKLRDFERDSAAALKDSQRKVEAMVAEALDGVNKRLAANESDIGLVRKQVDGVKEACKTVSDTVARHAADIRQINGQVAKLQADLAEALASIAGYVWGACVSVACVCC